LYCSGSEEAIMFLLWDNVSLRHISYLQYSLKLGWGPITPYHALSTTSSFAWFTHNHRHDSPTTGSSQRDLSMTTLYSRHAHLTCFGCFLPANTTYLLNYRRFY